MASGFIDCETEADFELVQCPSANGQDFSVAQFMAVKQRMSRRDGLRLICSVTDGQIRFLTRPEDGTLIAVCSNWDEANVAITTLAWSYRNAR